MGRCPACGVESAEGKRFCSECGASLIDTSAPTETSIPSQTPTTPLTGSSPRDPSRVARFLPGTMLSRRYRILGMLGRGGMGEVYRADDLKLGQAVALKLLPASVEGDPTRLDRFLDEVRLALKVTHPNVCRVFDIGEVEREGSAPARHFLSMEYVDGEDLASLLRRVGRLPGDRAVQVARQICAGLAAAHDQGVLHRDLKPANVMIDGRGRAKIADFGLAGATSGIRGAEARTGTPAYMAPEQLAGGELTERTDVYTLGLVLYELFTGKPAFDATNAAEMARLQRGSSPPSPASLVEGLDPAVERVILRCLEADPTQRPASALAVAAALPGGDPLAAALAAGETPSPEMVADAGAKEGLRPLPAAVCLVVVLLGLAGMLVYQDRIQLPRKIPLPKPPAELVLEAREVVEASGWTDPPADRVFGFQRDSEYFRWVEDNDDSADRWKGLDSVRPAPVWFWYRQSGRHFIPGGGVGSPGPTNPRSTEPGMIDVRVDPEGRLQRFQAIAPESDDSEPPASATDWSAFFALAGLEPAILDETRSTWNPVVGMDARQAWTGTYPGDDQHTVRVEAGSFRGRPVYFEVIPEWRKPEETIPELPGSPRSVAAVVSALIIALVFAGAAFLAWRNNRLGRSDRRGAFRLALFVMAISMSTHVLYTHHVAARWETLLLFRGLQEAVYYGLIIWLFYMAVEPYVRRLWPDSLIAWTRLLDGRFRDPLLGKHLLIGAVAGIGCSLFWIVQAQLLRWTGHPPEAGFLVANARARFLAGAFLEIVSAAFVVPVAILMVVLLLRVLLRRQWLAVTVTLVLASLPNALQGTAEALITGISVALFFGIFLFLLIRFGLFTGLVAVAFSSWESFALTLDTSSWFFGQSVAVMFVFAAVAVYGFAISLAGRPIFRDTVFGDAA